MNNYDIVATTTESTVVAKYTPEQRSAYWSRISIFKN